MGFLSGAQREGPLKNPKGKERENADPLKHVRSEKFINNGNISPCVRARSVARGSPLAV